MSNMIRGRKVSREEAYKALQTLQEQILRDLETRDITPELVIDAADRLSRSIHADEIISMLTASGMEHGKACCLVTDIIHGLGREFLGRKLGRELGCRPGEPEEVEQGIWERYVPLGVLTHISAGNAAGLPAMSVLEGLLAGNINLLKLPGEDDGLSTLFLSILVEVEPRLAPYIYVFDFPSQDVASIRCLLSLSDGVAVWGSDAAVAGIRSIAPVGITLIEWGNRLSFGYVTPQGESAEVLEGLADDICSTEQLLCNAPQCIFYETADREELLSFARRFADVLAKVSLRYPSAVMDIHTQAEITAAVELARMEEVLGEKLVIRDPEKHWCVMTDFESSLRPAPLFRTVWILPMERKAMITKLKPHQGILQTVGLACREKESADIMDRLIKSVVNRITPCGHMSHSYAGEPHDGMSALKRYMRRVSLRR